MDSDLAESISALKESLDRRGVPAVFGKADPDLVSELRSKLKIPRRYREFLAEANPVNVETRTGNQARLPELWGAVL